MTLVVDESYSIHTAGATNAVKTALRAFIDTLNNTGSTVAVVEFSEQATVPIQFTPLNDATRGQFDTYVNGFNPNGANTRGTNWDDGLYQANGIGGPADADLTLFLTDGQPNRSGPGHHPSSSNSTRILEYAQAHANEIKNSGTRMFVVGVGDVAGHTTELAAVSGPSRGTNIATNDYSTVTNFDDLAASLEDLVYGLCASSMTVSKYVDGVLAPGWDVTATITAVTGRSRIRLAQPTADRDGAFESDGEDRNRRHLDVRVGDRVGGQPTAWERDDDAQRGGQTRVSIRQWHLHDRPCDGGASGRELHGAACEHRLDSVRRHRQVFAEQPDDSRRAAGGADRGRKRSVSTVCFARRR